MPKSQIPLELSVPHYYTLDMGLETVVDLEREIDAIAGSPLFEDGILARAILTGDRTVVAVNKAFERMLGIEAEDIIGRDSGILYIDQDHFRAVGEIAYERLSRGETYVSEETLRKSDGALIDVKISGRRIPTHATVDLFLWIFEDVTEERALKRKLRHKSLFPAANPNIVFALTESCAIRDVNPAAISWLAQHGFSDQSGLLQLCPEHLDEVVRRSLDRLEPEVRSIQHDGRHYTFHLSPFPDRTHCYVTVIDVTDREQLLRNNQMFYAAFHGAAQAMIITDPVGSILHANDQFCAMYGYTPGEVIGRTPSILNPGVSVYLDQGYTVAEYSRVVDDMWCSIKNTEVGAWRGELIHRRKDGTIRWVHLQVSSVSDETRNIIALLWMPIDVTDRRDQQLRMRIEYCQAITQLAETRDNETGQHIRRIGLYSRLLAHVLGLSERFVDDIGVFAPHHDIGKVGVSDTILRAPRRLTADEFEEMKRHTEHGYRILHGRSSLEMAAEIARHHHERWDGGGYPDGLAGTEIPLSARIVALADVYDALRSERPYKRAWSRRETVDYIRGERGGHFDPEVVDTFLAVEDQFDEIFVGLSDDSAPADTDQLHSQLGA